MPPEARNSLLFACIPAAICARAACESAEPYSSRMSWLIRMEQNFGPHIEQKWAVLAGSAGSVSSWKASAVTGSSDSANWSRQRNSNRALDRASSRSWAPGWPLARSAAWAAIL